MIYLDTSVVLAALLAEPVQAAASLWEQPLVSSRLLEYEVWTRIHARGLGREASAGVTALLARIAKVELRPVVLERAARPFPVPVRTLDGLHLATIDFLRERRVRIALATFDARQAEAARALGIPLAV